MAVGSSGSSRGVAPGRGTLWQPRHPGERGQVCHRAGRGADQYRRIAPARVTRTGPVRDLLGVDAPTCRCRTASDQPDQMYSVSRTPRGRRFTTGNTRPRARAPGPRPSAGLLRHAGVGPAPDERRTRSRTTRQRGSGLSFWDRGLPLDASRRGELADRLGPRGRITPQECVRTGDRNQPAVVGELSELFRPSSVHSWSCWPSRTSTGPRSRGTTSSKWSRRWARSRWTSCREARPVPLRAMALAQSRHGVAGVASPVHQGFRHRAAAGSTVGLASIVAATRSGRAAAACAATCVPLECPARTTGGRPDASSQSDTASAYSATSSRRVASPLPARPGRSIRWVGPR